MLMFTNIQNYFTVLNKHFSCNTHPPPPTSTHFHPPPPTSTHLYSSSASHKSSSNFVLYSPQTTIHLFIHPFNYVSGHSFILHTPFLIVCISTLYSSATCVSHRRAVFPLGAIRRLKGGTDAVLQWLSHLVAHSERNSFSAERL